MSKYQLGYHSPWNCKSTYIKMVLKLIILKIILNGQQILIINFMLMLMD